MMSISLLASYRRIGTLFRSSGMPCVKAVAAMTSQLPVDVALGCTGSTWLSHRRFEDNYKLAACLLAGLAVVWRPYCFLSLCLFVSFLWSLPSE